MLSENYLKGRNWTFGSIVFSSYHSFLLKISKSEKFFNPTFAIRKPSLPLFRFLLQSDLKL